MARKPVILVDMDDTTCETSKKWEQILRDRHGVQPTRTNIYNKVDQYPMLAKDQVLAPIREEGFFSSLEPREGSLDVIRSWLAKDYDVRFASVVYPDCHHGYADKLAWIEEHIPEMAKRTIIFSSHDKTFLYGDILIDDHPRHIEDARWAWPIVMGMPWNEHLDDTRMRASTWKLVDTLVNNILTWKGLA